MDITKFKKWILTYTHYFDGEWVETSYGYDTIEEAEKIAKKCIKQGDDLGYSCKINIHNQY